MRKRANFSPAQSRSARGLLDWDRAQLARAAGLKLEAVELYERGRRDLSETEREALGAALNEAGVCAIPERAAGEGVRWRQRSNSRTLPAERFQLIRDRVTGTAAAERLGLVRRRADG